MSFFTELKRRNVVRVGIAYGLIAWVALQIVDFLLELTDAPSWVLQVCFIMAAIGLPIVLIFSWIFEMTPEGIRRESEVDRSASITPTTARKLDRVILMLAALGVAYLLVDRLWLDERAGSSRALVEPEHTQAQAADAPAQATPDPASVAVLPFVNMSGDPENEYFSDGLTETLLHMLAQLPELRVAARTSSFAFKGKDTGIAEIAAALGVAHVLEGSVQKAGGRVRVTAQLIRADDGFHVWSQNYTRPLEDIFAIQDEIATDVAGALDESLLGGDRLADLHGVETRNLDAYETYLKAMEQQAIFSYGSLGLAEGLFKQALAADPEFIEAKLGLARNYIMMKGTGLLTVEQAADAVRPLLQQVRDRQPDHPLARALELVLPLSGPLMMSEAERRGMLIELQALLALVPTEIFIRTSVATHLAFFEQQPQAALQVLQAGLLVDPLASLLHARLGDIYTRLKDFERARTSLLRAVELDPREPGAYNRLARLAADQNDLPGKLDWFRRAVEVDPQDHELAANLAYELYDLALPEEGDRWARRVAALAPTSEINDAMAVVRAAALGEWETVAEVSAGMLARPASFRADALPIAVFSFAQAYSELGRSREGLAVLQRIQPATLEFDAPPADSGILMMRWATAMLTAESAEPAQAARMWEQHVAYIDATGFPWREESQNRVIDLRMRGDLEGAIQAALEHDLAEPLANWTTRTSLYRSPLLAGVAQDPRVAARLAELDREKQQVRVQVQQMLLQPEWQP